MKEARWRDGLTERQIERKKILGAQMFGFHGVYCLVTELWVVRAPHGFLHFSPGKALTVILGTGNKIEYG